jgi:hypothetical protein
MKLLVSWSKGSLPRSDFALLDRRESGHDIYARRGILSRYLDLADDRRRAFSIVLVGNQIAEYLRDL